MTVARRFVVLYALLFWQGGFLFYSSMVVPVGTEVLGSAREQGFITRQVTQRLNGAGAVALVLLTWDLFAEADPSRRRRALRTFAWCVMLAAQLALFALHPRLDALLDSARQAVLDRPAFRLLHRWYLWIHTIQWGAGVVYLLLTLAAWRAVDRNGRLAERA